jgi:hypothetical protein
MNPPSVQNMPTRFRRLCLLGAIIFLFVGSSRANPIAVPEPSLTPVIAFLVIGSILIEVICVLFLLRRSRTPRLFILWLVGMHVLTYPAFLGLLWFLQDMRPAFAVAVGEGLVVLIEGSLIYSICRFVPSTRPDAKAPSSVKCFFASFVGNACSAAVFPILLAIHDRLAHP